MTLAERQEKAAKLHAEGANCAQAVALALYDTVEKEIGEKALFCTAEGFGLGLGSMNGVCGALSGAVLIAGLRLSGGSHTHPTKAETYRYTRLLEERFRERAGALDCHDLKGIGTGHVVCTCQDCISIAVEAACEILKIED